MKFFKRILEIIFPNHCIACEKIISSDGLFCSCCWQELQFITDPKCSICSNPFEFIADRNLICSSCLAKSPFYDKSVIIFHYNEIIARIIGNLKYRDATYIAAKLAKFLQNYVKQEIINCDLIIPVPLHKKRLRKRKFNQAVLLCQNLLPKFLKFKLYPDFLLRIKNTQSQVSLHKKQRQQNLRNAFTINQKYSLLIKDKKILLVDDVITTGATIENCAKVLKKYGAKKITVLAIAKTFIN